MTGPFSRDQLTPRERSGIGTADPVGQTRDKHKIAVAGDSDLPVDACRVVTKEPQQNLGATGRFSDPDIGVVQAKYVRFGAVDSDSGPAVFADKSMPEGLQVTNVAPSAADSQVLGVVASDQPVQADEYGWVIDTGLNPWDIEVEGSKPKAGDLVRLKANGTYSLTEGTPVARVVDPGKIAEGESGLTVKRGGILFQTDMLSAQSHLADRIGEVESSSKSILRDIDKLGVGRVTKADVDSLIGRLSLLLGEDIRRVERATYRLDESIKSITADEVQIERQQTLAAVANFARVAESHATNAAGDSNTVSYLAAAVNQLVDTARVYQDEAGVYAQSATEQANLALVSRHESNEFALAAATRRDEAEAFAGEAGEAATATQADRVLAETARAGAEAAESRTATSESNAAGSEAAAESFSVLSASASNQSRLALASTFPATMDARLFAKTSYDEGAPENLNPLSETYPSWVVDGGAALLPSAANPQISFIAGVKLVPGEIYECIAEVEQIEGTTSTAVFYYRVLDENWGFIDNIFSTSDYEVLSSNGQTVTVRSRFSLDVTMTGVRRLDVASGAAIARPLLLTNREPNSTTVKPSSRVKIKSMFIRSVTQEVNAGVSAEAAATSESNAAASATDSAQEAAASREDRLLAQTARSGAELAESGSASARNDAQGYAASAQSSAELSASLAGNVLNKNPAFAIWPDGASLPTGYTQYASPTTLHPRQDSEGLSPYALKIGVASGVSGGFFQPWDMDGSNLDAVSPGYYVVNADFEVNTLSWEGLGIFAYGHNAAGAAVDSNVRVHFKDLVSDREANRRYQVSKLVQIVNSTTRRAHLYGMTGWDGFGVPIAAKTVTWYGIGMRPATAEEIAAGVALPDLSATVQDMRGAAADSSGNVAAFIKLLVAASGGNSAMFELLAGAGGSGIGLVADVVALGNSVDGIIKEVLRVENGVAKIDGALLRDALVAPTQTSEIFHPVQLRPLTFLASDNEYVQYQTGDSYGTTPDRIEADISKLPALAEGETYYVVATGITSTGFTAKVKKRTAAPVVLQTGSSGSNVGGTPQFRINKPTAADAYDGNYEFKISVTLPKTFQFTDSENGDTVAEYSGSFEFWGYNASGNWVKITTQTISGTVRTQGTPPTAYNANNRLITVNSAVDFGSGSNTMGVHPVGGASIQTLHTLRYSTQSGFTETAVSGVVPFLVYPPTS